MDEMRVMMNKKTTIMIILLMFFSISISFIPNISAITINPGTYFQIGNENYSVSRSMTFSQIAFNATYITFNTTGFNISSVNDIYINLSYLHPTPTNVANNSRILTFNATTNAGDVQFNLSGFTAGYDYMVYRNGTNFVNVTANATGNIYFISSTWSMKNITVRWVNYPPTFSSPSPTNISTGVNRWHATNITTSDRDGDTMTVCFWNNKTGSWVKEQQNNTVTANTTVRDINASWASSLSTKYWWKVTADDGFTNSSVIYCFTTTTGGGGGGATAPTVTTNTTTSVGTTSAQFNGFLMDDGGDITTTGFWYDTDSGTPYAVNYTVGVTTDHTAFSYTPTLSAGTRYYIMAWATNPQGFDTGAETYVLTKPSPPILIVTTSTNTTITMTWTKGSGANYTRIQRSTTGYPTSISDGTNIYNNTGTTFTDTTLSPGSTYYYSAWSFTRYGTMSQWSSTYLQFAETTVSDPAVIPSGSMAFNSTDLLNEPWNTSFSAFTNLFGMYFFVIPVAFIGTALYVKKRDLPLTAVWFIIASVMLTSVSAYQGMEAAAIFFGVIAVVGMALLVLGIFYGRR